MAERSSLLLVGHGSRSAPAVAEYWDLAAEVQRLDPGLDVGCGFIELSSPDLDTAIDRLVDGGATSVVAVPLVLLGAGHMKNDGPSALARGRSRYPGVRFTYARDLGIHPLVLSVAEERARLTGVPPAADRAVTVVGRGSTDPDANADLYKVSRLLWDSRGLGVVEPAFVSLASPSVPEALDRCRKLGAAAIGVVPYFLFAGVLVDRIRAQTEEWSAAHPEVAIHHRPHLGADPRIARLVLERYAEATAGDVRMNCDLCLYRIALPGYEHRLGEPVPAEPHAHAASHEHPHAHPLVPDGR